MSNNNLEWKNGVPLSREYDDIYYSMESGVSESEYVFVQGNQLRKRWDCFERPIFQVGELGFGTGLNFLLVAQDYLKTDRSFKLFYASVESNPLSPEEIRKAIQNQSEKFEIFEDFLMQYPAVTKGIHRVELLGGRIVLDLVFDEVERALRSWSGRVDAWFFDGFNPRKNPSMWSQAVFEQCALKSNNDCTFSTFSSAGQVRRNLEAGGFEVRKIPGFSGKREMSVGSVLRKTNESTGRNLRDVIVIGGGLAGVSAAWALGKRGAQVSLFERAENWMEGASGNPVAVFMPRLVRDWVRLSRFSIVAYEYFKQHFNLLKNSLSPEEFYDRGVVEFGSKDKVFFGRDEFAEWQYSDRISELVGPQIDLAGWFFPEAGWVNPKAWGQVLLGEVRQNVKAHFSTGISGLRYKKEQGLWYLIGDEGQVLASAPEVVIATATETLKFPVLSWLPIRPVKGQVSLFETNFDIDRVFSNRGMVIPVGERKYCVGSTYDWKNLDLTYDSEDTYAVLKEILDLPFCEPAVKDPSNWKHVKGRAALRASTPDKLPLVGPVPNMGVIEPKMDRAWKKYLLEAYGDQSNIPGLSLLCAFGSRGLTQALLAAEIIASELSGEPAPLELELRNALLPERYLKKHLKREWPNAPRTGANQDHGSRSSK